AVGAATRRGVLIREGDVFERLATISTVCWDKTRTLTVGKPEVIDVAAFGELDEKEMLTDVAAVERFSEHPLAKAIVRYCRETLTPPSVSVDRFVAEPGRGAFGFVDGKEVFVGSARALAERNVAISDEIRAKVERFVKDGCAVVYVAIDGEAAGAIFLSDVERSTSAATIKRLQHIGVRSVMLTGDGEGAAATVAKRLGIDEFAANCLPENKLEEIAKRREAGERFCMVGEGVNDSPALAKATVGVAFGNGCDFAASVADVAVVSGDVKEVASLLTLARRTAAVVRFNLAFSLALNFLAVALAACGWLGPTLGALAHNAGSVLVVVNSAFLTSWREKV
ncbi:MAG: cation-translocating P-type ATPase, partial [Thermoguttaceae bacterium]|nr:cation-translocating P-type ATPase [Thermoguttaceae bacterium]